MKTPRWMFKRYAEIWRKRKGNEFTLKECAALIKRDKAITAVILSNLRKTGWLIVNFNPDDARRRLYRLREPDEIVCMEGVSGETQSIRSNSFRNR